MPMLTLTAVNPLPAQTLPAAAAALHRLDQLQRSLATELAALPRPDSDLQATSNTQDATPPTPEVSDLLRRVADYWQAPAADGRSRRELFESALRQGLRDELSVKVHERNLAADFIHCLPDAPDPAEHPAATAKTFSLHLRFEEDESIEVAGALIMSLDQGPALLTLPGVGATGFTSEQALRETLAGWLNAPTTRDMIVNCLPLGEQARLLAITHDPDLYLETFTTQDVQLQPLTGDPWQHAMDSLLNKQREDIRHACMQQQNRQMAAQHLTQIADAIAMSGLFGPQAMLERRELAYLERRYYRDLPDWIKNASQADVRTYAERLQQRDLAHADMLDALAAAASPEHFAKAQLRTRLADDLGYALDPDTLRVSTRRTLPLSGESYTVTRSLVELALYGLHPNDRKPGSDFLDHTRITQAGAELDATHRALNPAYLAQLIDKLDLRVAFDVFQRTAYGNLDNQTLMRTLTERQTRAALWAASMQGHIRPDDLTWVEALMNPAAQPVGDRVQQIRLHGGHVMGKLLVFRHSTEAGERLLLMAGDAPHDQRFWAFDHEIQLVRELVRWAINQDTRHYLLAQVEAGSRPEAARQIAALRLNTNPGAALVQFHDLPDFNTALDTGVQEQIRVALSEQAQHTPQWYLHASAQQRQQLVALEDQAEGALHIYQARPDTRVQPFEAYVHERASQQISSLLNVPNGSVDPDQIVISTERETVTYTQMLRNGYDDSIDFTRASADTQATFSGPPGVDLSALSPVKVARSVRGKWLADDYITLIKGTLLDPQSEGYGYRRQASVLINQLQMKAAALRSHLKGHIGALQYQWLSASLAHVHASDAQTRERFPLYPLQIHIDKPFIGTGLQGVDQLVVPSVSLTHMETVQGCIAVLPMTTRMAALLYTPLAPDGIEFRLFSSFVQSLDSPGMIDYYKDRCRVAARKNLSFFLHDMRQGNSHKPPILRAPIADYADTCFNRPILRKLRDVEETTTGRHDMLSRIIWSSVEIIATVMTLPFPPASFAVGALLSLHDSVRTLQALRDGDSDAASGFALASLFNGLGAAGDLYSGLKGFGRLIPSRAQATAARTLDPARSGLPRYEDLFPQSLLDSSLQPAKVSGHGSAPALTLSSPAPGPKPRPALAVDVSLRNVARISFGHAKGICKVDGLYYIELSGSTYRVQYNAPMRCWQVIDPANPFAFFGKKPLRLDDQGQWHLADPHQLRGGGLEGASGYRPLQEEAGTSTAAASLQDYELPQQMRHHLDVILTPRFTDPTSLGLEAYFEAHFADMRQTFTRLREKLYQDANAFFVQPTIPPRPPLPALTATATVEELVEGVFTRGKGLVLSESPKSVASKRLLILNMPLLAEQRVEVLYIEHLFTDKHLHKLARYRQLGKKTRSGSHEIKYHLENLNNGALANLTSEYDYYHLVKAAHRHGIEVRPLNSAVSYPLVEHPVASAAQDPAAAHKMSAFFGHRLIAADIAVDPSKRWIALLDRSQATTHQQLPGIAELQGVISVHVRDVPAGRPTRVLTFNAGNTSDLTVEFANPVMIATSPAPGSAVTPLDNALLNALSSRQSIEAGESWAGDYGFRWDPSAGWVRIENQDWVASRPLSSLQQSLIDATYDMPPATRGTLHYLANFETKGLDANYLFQDPDKSLLRQQFFTLRATLQHDARQVISASLPPRPVLPAVTPQTPIGQFLETLYQHTDAVVIGESHASIASKKLIIDNLPLLSRQNVKTLYMEHLLTDLHQADLDRFYETGQMSKTLLHDLKKMDRGHRTDPARVYTFERLVVQARAHGLEIRAIDCSASYHLKGLVNEAPTSRQQMMNYFASRTIGRHQQVMGSHKWIALVGNSHSNTFQNIVPGIAELEGGIGLRVSDAAPGTGRGITLDPGEFARLDVSERTVQIKGDYRVEIEIAAQETSVKPPQSLPVEERLSRPGKFLIEEDEHGVQCIVHRSRDGQIHRTPVLVDAQGRVYVERPSWAVVHLTPYADMDALVGALEALNLTRVA